MLDAHFFKQNIPLKLAFRELVESLGGQASAAEQLGRSQSVISDYCNPQKPATPAIGMVLRAESLSFCLAVTKKMVELHGGLLLMPPAQTGEKFAQEISKMMKEAGEALAKATGAYAQGGTITCAEIVDLELVRELDEAIEATMLLRDHLLKVVGGEA